MAQHNPGMLQPDAACIHDLLAFDRLVPALREAFVAGASVPLRHTHAVQGGTSLIMPAWDDRFYGVKVINICPDNQALGLPGLHASYLLHDVHTGVPLALLDGNAITARRTAAAAALATSFLAREDASRLVVVGTGRVGSLVPAAMAVVRRLSHVALWDIDAAAAQRCAADLHRQGLPAEAVADLQAAVRAADIVSCATLATAPVIQADWLVAGSHLDLIGSFTPQMTEAAPGCFANASVWVDTDEAPAKSGDLLNALAAGTLTLADLRGDLAALCRGLPGRGPAAERTVFKAVGSALEDLAAARLVYGQLAGAA